jgi:hypothetical protein
MNIPNQIVFDAGWLIDALAYYVTTQQGVSW